jgi:rubrerythrin
MATISMATVKATATEANLQVALSAETQACRRYRAYAERAQALGNTRAAARFHELADRSANRAALHLEALESCSQEAEDSSNDRTVYTVRAGFMQEMEGAPQSQK